MTFEELIGQGGVNVFRGGRISKCDLSRPLIVMNPRKMSIEADVSAQIIIVHSECNKSLVEIEINENCNLSLTDIYTASCFSEIKITQHASSLCRGVVVELSSSNVAYKTRLVEEDAESELAAIFVASGSDNTTFDLTTRHEVSSCRSRALAKGIASGRATGCFKGMVYVAPDAQHTDAEQQSRNIELDNGHIQTMPQLEIYADDVRCSHGATVGRTDDEQIYYLRQRGISEKEAQRLLLEGYVSDVVNRSEIVVVKEIIEEAVANKLLEL